LTGYLLDTHALIWWNSDERRLGRAARAAIEDPDATIFASAVNAFEISIKHGLGKLPVAADLLANYSATLARTGFLELAVETSHALRAGMLALGHRDPFDRLLIGQALVENLTLLSNEKRFDVTGVSRIWD
jgi:PIN domain nuclease of toxin-antitoxin system